MRRRELITLLGCAAAAWPLAVRAQQTDRVRRIGVLMGYAESDSQGQAQIAAFRDGLQKLGWTEGRNTRIDTRWATPADTTMSQKSSVPQAAISLSQALMSDKQVHEMSK